jgi:hypothetical protein
MNGEVLRAQLQPILLALGGQQELTMLEGEMNVYASRTVPDIYTSASMSS